MHELVDLMYCTAPSQDLGGFRHKYAKGQRLATSGVESSPKGFIRKPTTPYDPTWLSTMTRQLKDTAWRIMVDYMFNFVGIVLCLLMFWIIIKLAQEELIT